jgi:phage gpG-like protein
MSGLKITHLFFDSAKVVRTAKQSIRKRKKTAPPGQTPSSHTGLLKRFIFFGYEPLRRSVVIGPERLDQKNTDAPHTLEYGGRTTVDKKRVRISARPFMGPAFEKEKTNLPSMWKNSVKE